jgi:hypothetical protein
MNLRRTNILEPADNRTNFCFWDTPLITRADPSPGSGLYLVSGFKSHQQKGNDSLLSGNEYWRSTVHLTRFPHAIKRDDVCADRLRNVSGPHTLVNANPVNAYMNISEMRI